MTYRALIVEDDPGIVDVVQDGLHSLGHEFDTAVCQDDARQCLAKERYDYYLLDLEIPVHANHGLPRVQNGENLLREIVARRGGRREPIIIMTSHGTNGPDLAVQMMKLGANDYITKPFATAGRTLDRAILDALGRGTNDSPTTAHLDASQVSEQPSPFAGGELVFFPDRIELCSAVVVRGQCLMRQILDKLRSRQPSGKYVAIGGAALAKRLDRLRGQNAIAEAVSGFRDAVVEALASRGIACGRQDVILSGGLGYRLSETIIVSDGAEKMA